MEPPATAAETEIRELTVAEGLGFGFGVEGKDFGLRV